MKLSLLVFVFLFVSLPGFAQSSPNKPPVAPHPNGPAAEELQTEKVFAPGQSQFNPNTQAGTSGFMDPGQIKALMHRIWLAQYHLTDLLTQIHSEKWNISPSTQQSFGMSLDSLRKSIAAEERWRGQYDVRPESLYLGFETYMSMGALLPRVDGVAKSVSKYENPSFGGQFTQAANQLFDLQQVLEPHLEYLLKNQDNAMLVIQNNLASCQTELSFAEHNKEGHAAPMKNIVPEFKGRKRIKQPASSK